MLFADWRSPTRTAFNGYEFGGDPLQYYVINIITDTRNGTLVYHLSTEDERLNNQDYIPCRFNNIDNAAGFNNTGSSDYIGLPDHPITDIAIQSICDDCYLAVYRVHNRGGGWLPWVYSAKYNLNDAQNGYGQWSTDRRCADLLGDSR